MHYLGVNTGKGKGQKHLSFGLHRVIWIYTHCHTGEVYRHPKLLLLGVSLLVNPYAILWPNTDHKDYTYISKTYVSMCSSM